MSTDEPGAAAEGQSADVTDPATVPPKRRRFRMSGKKWLLLSVAFVVLVAAGVGGWMFSRSRNTAANQTTSRTVQATLGTQTQTVSLDGTLSPRKQSDVNFAVSGTITTVYVKAGDTVSKGQKLARVDDTDLQDAVDVASVLKIVHENSQKAAALLTRLLRDFPAGREACPIGSDRALDSALITARDARDPAFVEKLGVLLARVNAKHS